MWNCHSFPLDVSRNVKLPVLTTGCQHQGDISDSLSGYPISHLILVTSSIKSQGVYLIADLGTSLTSYIGHFIWQVLGEGVYLIAYLGTSLTSYIGHFIWQVPGGMLRRVTSDMTQYNANWLFTNLIIQKKKEIPNFSWRIQNDCQIHPIIYIPWCIWRVDLPADLGDKVKLPFSTTWCQ